MRFSINVTFRKLVCRPYARNTTASHYFELELHRAAKFEHPSTSKISVPEYDDEEEMLKLKNQNCILKDIKK